MVSAHAGLLALAVSGLLLSALADVVVVDDSLTANSVECDGLLINGTMKIGGMGQAYLAGHGGSTDNGQLTLKHNSGFSVFSACEKRWAPKSMTQFKLLGRTISFTVDLSKVGCACNFAFYLISSPAHDAQGNFSRGSDRQGQPPYYCDANKVGGQWCPEVDIVEANNNALQSTLHKCGAPTNGHYTHCDRSGCSQNTNDKHGSYGPGHRYTIDTRHPFDVHTEFPEEDGVLRGMRQVLRQGERKVVLEHADCDREYLAALSDAMKDGMSLRITYWGDTAETMAWMDSPPCGNQTCGGRNAGHAVLSGISVSPKHSLKYYRSRGWREPRRAGEPEQSPWGQSDPASGGWPGQQTASWAAPEGGARAEPGALMRWVADEAAAWQCHQYINDQAQTMWCKTAGIQGGYEYSYNAGKASPCGGCWCCKRAAKEVPAPPAEDAHDDVWVVSDQSDPMSGQVVPKDVLHDAGRFVQLQDHGLVEWKGERHFVRRQRRGEAPCEDGSEGPCEASIRGEAASLGVFLQKYAAGSPLTGLGNVRQWWTLCATCAIAAALLLAAISMATRRIRAQRIGATESTAAAGASPGAQHKEDAPSAPHGEVESGLGAVAFSSECSVASAASCEAAAGQSQMRRKVSWSASEPISVGMRRAGSSCQRLISLQEGLA